MIELLLAVCLIDNPATCKDVSLTYSAEALTPMQCVMRAEPEIAKWITEHPGWQTSASPAVRLAATPRRERATSRNNSREFLPRRWLAAPLACGEPRP